jgi:hypothetical protein
MSEHFNKKIGNFIDNTLYEKLRSNWKKTGIATQSNFFGMDVIDNLRQHPNAAGITIEYGINDEGIMQPILFAADDEGRKIITSAGKDGGGSGGADASSPCPPYCPK